MELKSLRWCLIPAILVILCGTLFAEENQWTKLEEGLYLGVFEAPVKSLIGDSKITIVKIDPQYYSFRLLCASENGGQNRTTKSWCQAFQLTAAVNAGMFLTDGRSNVGFMKNYNSTNNPKIHPDYSSFTVFNPQKSDWPPFRIYDSEEIACDSLVANYHTVVQNLRLIKRPAENRWTQQPKIWSEAALGQDKNGHILFIFCRSPYSMHDFNDILLHLPLDLVCAQHLEGGPYAQLYLRSGEVELDLVGSYETRFFENDQNLTARAVPNVIGIVKN